MDKLDLTIRMLMAALRPGLILIKSGNLTKGLYPPTFGE